ncbi:MAG: cytochrome [Hyphomicrobiales bacterium]|nr:cytochrome [Hyphomicrobiales bacterium]
MISRFYRRAAVIEERGEDYFIPAHPEPRAQSPGFMQVVLGARYSLIDNWISDHYRTCVDEFRILRRQVVLVNAPEHIKHVLVTCNSNYERKSPQMRRALAPLLGDGLFISDGETWKTRRPIVADIVHKRRMPEFAPVMEHAASALADAWAELPAGTEFDLTGEMAQLTAQIVARSVFGQQIGAAAAAQVVDGFSAYQGSVDSFNLGYFLGADAGWPLRLTRRRETAIRMVHSVVESAINAHLSGDGDAGSMIDLLIRRKGAAAADLDLTALRNEAATIFMAGHETTAATLTWVFYLVANAPWIERRLHAELAQVCGPRAPGLADLPRLPWCRAVIQEALRLYPPVPLLPRQALAPDTIAHVRVEKDALVMIAPWLLHRARDLWDRPNHFLPERFVSGPRMSAFAYIPFSVGPRICAGMNFGQDEAALCLAILAQRFRVVPREGYRVEPACRLTLRPANGLPVSVVARKAAA